MPVVPSQPSAHLPKAPQWWPALFSTSAMVTSSASSGTCTLLRTRPWPECLPVINAQRLGAHTVFPA